MRILCCDLEFCPRTPSFVMPTSWHAAQIPDGVHDLFVASHTYFCCSIIIAFLHYMNISGIIY